ncbi:MAG TPA: acyltransferase, partial [Parafilimonas sp.]|nr:acyltransferase [Parafilimonas sp.]
MRLKEIDFLRGIAIILVLFRHHLISNKLYQIGWIGVDLFFVLSGFLVSGLLFREYKKSHRINVRLFLIRRGFKIYPLFYVFILLTAFMERFVYGHLNMRDFFSEAFFVQNYFGNIWWHTWSLAIEEHFYFGLAFFILFLAHKKLL